MNASASASPSVGPGTVFTTPEEALRAVGALLARLVTEQPGALAIVIVTTLVAALIVTGVPACILVCVWKRRHAQTAYAALSSTERLAMRSPEDMHVVLDDSGEELTTMTPRTGSFKLPRLAIPTNRAIEHDADMHMTPRTRDTIVRQWTPRKPDPELDDT